MLKKFWGEYAFMWYSMMNWMNEKSKHMGTYMLFEHNLMKMTLWIYLYTWKDALIEK